jgi:hypothetical protein
MATFIESEFFRFMQNIIKAEPIDKLIPDRKTQAARADFLAYNRKAIIEVKSLTEDVSIHLYNELDKYRHLFPNEKDHYSVEEIIGRLPNKAHINREIFKRVTRNLEASIRNANRQIIGTKNELNLRGSFGVLAILNAEVSILSPKAIALKLNEMLCKQNGDELRYPHIAYGFVLTAAHVKLTDDSIQWPVITFEGPTAVEYPCSDGIMQDLTSKWISYVGQPRAADEELDLSKPQDVQALDLIRASLDKDG